MEAKALSFDTIAHNVAPSLAQVPFFMTPDVTAQKLMKAIFKHAQHSRVKDETLEHIKKSYEVCNLENKN